MPDFDKGWKGSRPDGPVAGEYLKGWDARPKHIDDLARGGPHISGSVCSAVLFIGALMTALLLATLWK